MVLGTLMKDYLKFLDRKEATKVIELCRTATTLVEGTLAGKGSYDWLAETGYRGLWYTYGENKPFSKMTKNSSMRDEFMMAYYVRCISLTYPAVADPDINFSDENRRKFRQAVATMARICLDGGQNKEWDYAPLLGAVGDELKTWVQKSSAN